MKNRKCWRMALGLMFVLALSVYAAAQTNPEAQKVVKAEVKVVGDGKMISVTTADGQPQAATFSFVSSEMGFESKVTKGAPFSADAVTEFSQTLANGQHISRKSTSSIYRDYEGRTRREQTINVIGSWVSSSPARQTILINDPVAGEVYVLDPENHTAKRMMISSSGAAGIILSKVGEKQATQTMSGTSVTIDGVSGAAREIKVQAAGGAAGGYKVITTDTETAANTRKESLGTQMIEGVQAEGTRVTETIPAGAIGNDSPIDIVSESWFSPELGMVVKTVHSDPRVGDNTYMLTNIRRGEPSPGLFQIPADYTVKESGDIKIQTIKKIQ